MTCGGNVQDESNSTQIRPTAVVAAIYDEIKQMLVEAARHSRGHRIELRCRSVACAIELISDLRSGIRSDAADPWSRQTDALLRTIIGKLPLVDARNDADLAEQLAELIEPLRQAWRALDDKAALSLDLAAARPGRHAGLAAGLAAAD